jgi:tetratricopeptide (TPR) repeat protein
LNVLLRKTLVAASVAVLATLTLVPAAPAAAQEIVQDEGSTYRAWHDASQKGDNAAAMAAAKAYLEQYPSGEYVDFLKKWYSTAQMTALDAAIKDRKTAEMVAIGKEILAADPENLNVLYALAFNIRRNELLASPQKFDHGEAGVELARKAIELVEAGRTLTGVQSFDKNATLAWLTQVLAMNEGKSGSEDKAIELYEKSTALSPDDPQIAARNLLAIVALRQGGYAEKAKAFNALPEADRAAAEPPAEVLAARDALHAEADGLIDAAARFVAFGKTKGLPAATIERVNQTLETVYKGRFPEDAELEGLKKILAEKGVPAGA